MLLSLAWFESGNDNGTKNMVILPYKDRLELFSKYLQQLVMESLEKNWIEMVKWSIRELRFLEIKERQINIRIFNNCEKALMIFFATFIEVLNDGHGSALMVEEKVTAGDFLHGFYLGTRKHWRTKIVSH